MTETTLDRRELLRQGAATILSLPFLSTALKGQAAAALTEAAKPQGEITHLPDDYRELFNLNDEQKVMISALVASGGDAAAYYESGREKGQFTLKTHFDLYHDAKTPFAETLEFQSKANLVKQEGAEGTSYLIPVRAPDGTPKGVIALHESPSPYQDKEPEYCRAAKRKMAVDIVSHHADLFGVSGALLRAREATHRTLDEKRRFFLALAKDMFATLTRNLPEANPAIFPEVQKAADADSLKAALREKQGSTSSDQYPHVLGVSDLMEHILKKGVNGDPANQVMTPAQVDLVETLTLLHDIGKTQLPSDFMSSRPEGDMAEREFGANRNGSHPLFTLMTLLMYPNDAMDSATHHLGLRRYGPEEIAELKSKKKVSENFEGFTELRGDDVTPQELPQLAKLMRVADVAEAITGRIDIPLHEAVKQLGSISKTADYRKKVRPGEDGQYVIGPDTMDPDCVCFAIANGVFKAYGEQRVKETNGWVCKRKGDYFEKSKYDPQALAQVEAEILKTFDWDKPEVRAEKEKQIRAAIAADPLLRDKGEPKQEMSQSMAR